MRWTDAHAQIFTGDRKVERGAALCDAAVTQPSGLSPWPVTRARVETLEVVNHVKRQIVIVLARVVAGDKLCIGVQSY